MREIRSRHEAITLAKEILQRKPVYLDTETTGLGPSDEIVEISILDSEGEILTDTLVKPTRSIPRDAHAVHGITDAMVATAPTWQVIWPEIEPHLTQTDVAIFNADFDMRLMRQSHTAHDMAWSLPEDRVFCIMRIYAAFYGEWDFARNAYRWQSLDRARGQLMLPFPNTHRAKDDALLARSVLHAIAAG